MHHCHATACTTPVPERMFMCKKHWFMVPWRLRKQIWKHYTPGQEDTKEPTAEYCRVAAQCVEFVALREGISPDTRLYRMFEQAAKERESSDK